MRNVYEKCPVYENERYLLRRVAEEDWQDLLKVYSDVESLPFFNRDNCDGDNFFYTSPERMKQAIDFWIMSYDNKYFVRWAVVDKAINRVVGTIELFHRNAEDYFTDCGLLRLDLRSDYELRDEIESIVKLILTFAFDDFQCDKVATKAVPEAVERIPAIEALGFHAAVQKLTGNDGTEYDSYYVIENDLHI